MKVEKFIRKVTPVEAILVTDENMDEVATWCGGLVVPINGLNQNNSKPYIHVPVRNARSDADTRAFAGTYILKDTSYYQNLRVMDAKKFKSQHEPVVKAKTAAPSPKSLASKGVPTPRQVGAVAVTPGTPPEAGSNLTTGAAVAAIEVAAEKGAISQVDAANARSEISNAEAHDAVARDVDAPEIDGDMVQLGQPVQIVNELCDECGSPVVSGVCSNNSSHIVSSAAEVAQNQI